MSPTFLITSATGSQGGSTARELLLRGAKIHALVRSLTSPSSLALQSLGMTLFQGDFFSLPTIRSALIGVTGVFLNTFPNFAEVSTHGEIVQARNIVNAAKEAGVRRFVVSTVYRAGERKDVVESFGDKFPFLTAYLREKAGVEEVVKEAGFESWTVLRPDWLDYNYLSPGCLVHFPEYPDKHVLSVSYAPDFKKANLDPYDVGKLGAAALLEPERFHGRTIEIRGEELTFEEVAEVLSRVSGMQVSVRYRTEEETKELIESGKMPVIEMQIWEKEVKVGLEYDPGSLNEYGIELGTLEGYLAREKERLLDTLGVERE